MATYGAIFNGIDLEAATPGLKIISKDVHSIPVPVLEQYILARYNIQKFVAINYPQRKIVLKAVMNGGSVAAAESNLDTLKNILGGLDKTLVLPYSGSQRQWVGTMSALQVPVAIGTFFDLPIEFTCSQPIGQDVGTTAPTIPTITTASSTPAITIGGSAPAYPLITITLGSGTGLTAQSMTISNPANGMAITITRTWTAGDVVVIDCLNQTVTVNAVATDAAGSWPSWVTGAGQYGYADTFTTRSVTTTFVYNRMWL